MVNKKGYLMTVEAIIALVIILSIAYIAIPKEAADEQTTPSIVESSQQAIVKEIAFNNELKSLVIDDQEGAEALPAIGQIIEDNMPRGFKHAFKICSNPGLCLCGQNDADCQKPAGDIPADVNVYMSDVFISSTLPGTQNKLVRFWMWR